MTNPLPAGRVFLEDALLLTVDSDSLPKADIPEGMDRINTNPRRISLVSKRAMRAIRPHFEALNLTALSPPTPIFGEPRLVTRKATEARSEMACLVSAVQNQEEIALFVNNLFASLGLKNPEKRFLYHLTVANNAGGNPRGSIAYLNPADFQGPAPVIDRVFEPRQVEEVVVFETTQPAIRRPSLSP